MNQSGRNNLAHHIYVTVIAGACLLLASLVQADDLYGFTSTEQWQRFQSLTEELRCPKCQNQSIADSDSGISSDMRKKVALMIQDGATDEEIISFFVDRYGIYVTYRPPLNEQTFWLWFIPLAVLMAGAVIVVWQIRKAANKQEAGE